MQKRQGSSKVVVSRTVLLGAVIATLVPFSTAPAQEAAPGGPIASAAQPPPAVPPPRSLESVPVPSPAATREAQLETRLRRMEEANQRLLQQFDALSKKYDDMSKRVSGGPATGAARGTTTSAAMSTTADDFSAYEIYPGGSPIGPEGTIGRGTSGRYRRMGEGGAGGEVTYSFAPPSPVRTGGDTTRGGGPARGPEGTIGRRGTEGESRPVRVTVGNGLRFDTNDDEFQLQFHDLTQAELRNFPGLGDQSPLKTQFFIPRQRWYFTGRATKNLEFYTVINRGYGSLDLLDAFLNFNYDSRLQFRIGRTKTPTSYEYYQIAEGDLIAPERSLFIGNYAGNRQDGAMFHGVILDKRAEWALGVFNGPRRSFGDTNNDKDLYLFYNMRPFQNTDIKALKIFNIGGAFNFGNERNPTQPQILATANDQTTGQNDVVIESLSPTFFAFNNNVVESGPRAQWSGWIAWYWNSFNILAEYDGGFQDYATSFNGPRTRVPLEGFSITPYYFITGERITRRVDIKPDNDFGFKNGRLTGLGAIEVYSRYSYMNIGQNVFAAGLSDPNLWSNQAYTVDTGFNWYLNRYTKIYFDWQHAVYGNAVYNGPNELRKTSNLFWIRFQLFF